MLYDVLVARVCFVDVLVVRVYFVGRVSFVVYLLLGCFSWCTFVQVIPPSEWCPRPTYDDIGDFKITTPISQLVTGQQGVYQLYNIQKKPLTFAEFSAMAGSDK